MSIAIPYSAPVQPNDSTYWGTPHVTTTHLPQNTAIVRAIAIKALAAYICIFCIKAWCWPVLVISSILAIWTIYAHILRPDPLVEKLYQIAGGKDKFLQLPLLPLSEKPLDENIKSLNWDTLEKQVYRAKTIDGRQVLIVKGLSKENDKDCNLPCQIKSIFAFVEKLGPADYSEKASNLSQENTRRFLTFLDACVFKGNTAGTNIASQKSYSGNEKGINRAESSDFYMFSSISDKLADEICQSVK